MRFGIEAHDNDLRTAINNGPFNSTHRAENGFGLIAPIEPVLRQSDLNRKNEKLRDSASLCSHYVSGQNANRRIRMSGKAIVMAFVALVATAASPALAGDSAMQDRPSDACKAQLHDSLYAPGAAIKGFAHEASGYGRWPADIVVECSGECPEQSAF